MIEKSLVTGPKRVTLLDLSKELGISATTVSLVLKGQGDQFRIAKRTQQKVLDKAKEMKYRPNFLAQALLSKKTMTIGVVFPDIHELFMNHLLKGIEKVLYSRNYSIMVSTSYFNPVVERRNLEGLLHREVDGVILVPYAPFSGESYSCEHITYALSYHKPIIAVDRFLPGILETAVISNDRQVAEQATRTMLAWGCRTVGFVGFDLAITSLDERKLGWMSALEAARIDSQSVPRLLLRERKSNAPDIELWVAELVKKRAVPDGIMVSTNGLAYKLRHVLLGYVESGELENMPLISRFGEDNKYFPSGMVEIRQPHTEMGEAAAELMLDLISGKEPGQKQYIIPSEVLYETK